jgi:membrane-associated phospholipid phosphatase
MKDVLIPVVKKKNLYWLFVPAGILLSVIVWLVFVANDNHPDEWVFNALSPHITAARTGIMKKISFFANHKFLIPANLLLTVYFLVRRNRHLAIVTMTVAFSSFIIMSLLKNFTQRHRPAGSLVEGITNYSFPSGHAFMGVAFYGLLIWLTFQKVDGKWNRLDITAFVLLVLLAIGISRIYLRVHYFTDVLAGFCLGTMWLLICLALVNKTLQRNNTTLKPV